MKGIRILLSLYVMQSSKFICKIFACLDHTRHTDTLHALQITDAMALWRTNFAIDINVGETNVLVCFRYECVKFS